MVNTNLPIFEFKDIILDAVRQNNVVVITAETGAGKSTQVPQFLLEEGYRMVVTQPRRLAARTVAERVAEEVGCELGTIVGYRTAFERNCSEQTRALFCTDGLQLVRELTGRAAEVLIIDEVHEWNINIETLVAWSRKKMKDGWNIKVVLMSATLESEKLARYYGKDVPVIGVPGRTFKVEERKRDASELVPVVEELVRQRRNVLVFQPGKKEIAETCEQLKNCGAEILPLHGDLEPEEQRRCFKSYYLPKVVVATNIAQTSVTISDIDAVVDTGVERRVELSKEDGIEGLYLRPISQADCEQRKGRAGRTKDGLYFLCSRVPKSERPDFPKAEVERSRLDQLVLRLAVIGIDATDLKFFHQPDLKVLSDAKRLLKKIGAMEENGKVTSIGRTMARLPVSVQYARMIVEASKLGVVDDVITVAALLEVGGIRDKRNSYAWGNLLGNGESDLLAELKLWKMAEGREGSLSEMGIFKKSFFRAKEIRQKLFESLYGLVDFGSSGDVKKIRQACVTGLIDHIFRRLAPSVYGNGDGSIRKIDKNSVVKYHPEWIVGVPVDIEVKKRFGSGVLNLVSMVTAVDLDMIKKIAPQLFTVRESSKLSFNPREDAVFFSVDEVLDSHVLESEFRELKNKERTSAVFMDWLADEVLPREFYWNFGLVGKKLEKIQAIRERVREERLESKEQIKKWLERSFGQITRIADIPFPLPSVVEVVKKEVPVRSLSTKRPDAKTAAEMLKESWKGGV